MKFDDFDALANELDKNDGVATVAMWKLRDAYGADRLGRNVVDNMANEMAKSGIGCTPELTLNQMDEVRVYRVGSAVGRIIDAANTMGEKADKVLRQAAKQDSDSVLRKIKELVCD